MENVAHKPSNDSHTDIIDHGRFTVSGGPGCQAQTSEHTRTSWRLRLLVRLSGYGTKNAPLLDAMVAFPDRFRAIAMVWYDCTDRELEKLAQVGVVGVRFNLSSYDPHALLRPDAPQLLVLLNAFGRFAQAFANDEQWAAAAPALSEQCPRAGRSFRRAQRRPGMDQKGFQSVLQLGCEGRAVMGSMAAAGDSSLATGVARDLAHERERRVRRERAVAASTMVRRVIRRVSTGDAALRRLPCERSAVRDRVRQKARDAAAGRTRVLGQHVAAAGGN